MKKRIPWNKGKKGVQVAWNKGKKGVQVGWSKGLTKETDVRVRKRGEARIGKKYSAKSKRKMSVTRKKLFASGYVHPMKGTKLSPERRREMSLARKGKKYAPGRVHHFKGKKLSPGHRKNISSGLKGHITTEETRRKIGAKNKLAVKRFWENMTESQKEKWKKKFSPTWYKKGQVSPMKGKKMSEETRMKLIRTFSTPEFRELRRVQRSRIKIPMKDTKPEKIVQAFCKSKKIKFQTHKWFDLGFQRAEVDLFIEPNICILVDGDWIHANPNLIKPDGTMRYTPDRVLRKAYKNRPEKTVLDKWVNDDMITKGLKKQNCKVHRFWEHDILNNPEIFRQEIIKAITR